MRTSAVVIALLAVGIVVLGASTNPVSHATGEFDAKMAPLEMSKLTAGSGIDRFSLDKTYRGGLEATAVGEMLGAGSLTPDGSAVYVAVETVSGTLAGRKGTFVLYHTGLMKRGAPNLSVKILEDSGTGELVGLTGTMTITVTAEKHAYDLEYSLPAKP